MNRLKRLKGLSLDQVKSPIILGVIGGLIVLLLVWWFAWMAPEQHKLSSVRAQQSADQTTVAQLQAEIAQLQAEAAQVQKSLPYLKKAVTAIPPAPDPGGIVNEIDGLANKTHVTFSSITDNTVVPPAATATTTGTPTTTGVSTIPIQFTISGSHKAVFAFMEGFYSLPRLMTISSVALTPGGTNPNILAVNDGQTYTAAFSGTAYTTYVPSA